MDHGPHRRQLLAALGASSASVAGCLDAISDDSLPSPDDGGTDGDGGDGDDEETDDGGDEETDGDGSDATSRWPAIDAGEVISDFEDLDEWTATVGTVEPAPDGARTGSQAALLESDEETAGMRMDFADGIDLVDWDVSLAVRADAVSRIVVEFLAPNRDRRLTTVRIVPDDFDGWFRLDCGYEQKPAGEPDLSTVTRINVVAVGPDGGPTRIAVDDLRRTAAVETGTAILAFYGGHQSQFDLAADLLEERGWAAAVAVDPRRIGGRGRMSADELRDLRDRGWDVCSYPRADADLATQPEDRQRAVMETVRDSLVAQGFETGARHFFAPEWRQLTPTTLDLVRDLHESGFVFGGCPTGAPPTGTHTTPVIWGPALHSGVRRHINLCDQYRKLTVIRIPRIVEGEASSGSQMSLADFESLLDHLEVRGLDVVTPSDVVDGNVGGGGGGSNDETLEEGVVLEAGESHSIEGSGTTESESFDLDAGVVTASTSSDDAAITVELLSDGGDAPPSPLATGTGESIAAVSAGSYRLSVEADGEWSVDLDQPEVHSDDVSSLPIETSGSGSAFVGPLWSDGDLRLEVTHDGDGTFIVDGHGANGHTEQIVNKDGSFDGGRSYAVSGVNWVNVEASGDWTLTIQEG